MIQSNANFSEFGASVPQLSALAKTFSDYLDRQRAICDDLESIADSLPNNLNNQICLQASKTLLPLIKQAHQFEEAQLFPVLRGAGYSHLGLDQTIKRLNSEHLCDEDYAEDLCKAIQNYLVTADHSRAECLGWMLRGFFENIRRHVACEREQILPLINKLE